MVRSSNSDVSCSGQLLREFYHNRYGNPSTRPRNTKHVAYKLLEVNIKMGNTVSRPSASRASLGDRHQDQVSEYFDFLGLPLEIQIMVAAVLCPHCGIAHDEIPSTEEAKKLQRDLGNLARCSSHLLTVANAHRFHSFVMAYDPAFNHRRIFPADPLRSGDIEKAHQYNNGALPELMERLINYGQLRDHLRFLSIRDFTLRLKAGITTRRLRLFMNASQNLQIPVPDFVPALLDLPSYTIDHRPSELVLGPCWWRGELWLPENPFQQEEDCTKFDVWLIRLLIVGLARHLERLLIDPIIAQRVFSLQDHPAASLDLVTTLGIPPTRGDIPTANEVPICQVDQLLQSFPNLRVLQIDNRNMLWDPFQRTPADSPPFYPNLRRLVLRAEQPSRLHFVTQILREFPCLEELYFHRRDSIFPGAHDPGFSNANVFNGVHHRLRRLTYSGALIKQCPDPDDFQVIFNCYEEPSFLDVPHFGGFAVLEDLVIDQGYLGRMSTFREWRELLIGPHFPDLDWKLPQSLRRLTIRYVYDWPNLAAQLAPLAIAKSRGQFPMLSDIFVVTVQGCTVKYTGEWPVYIPLSPYHAITRSTWSLMEEVGIKFRFSTEGIGPPPDNLDDFPNDVETPIAITVRKRFFQGL